jgi:hypothetical protein
MDLRHIFLLQGCASFAPSSCPLDRLRRVRFGRMRKRGRFVFASSNSASSSDLVVVPRSESAAMVSARLQRSSAREGGIMLSRMKHHLCAYDLCCQYRLKLRCSSGKCLDLCLALCPVVGLEKKEARNGVRKYAKWVRSRHVYQDGHRGQ